MTHTPELELTAACVAATDSPLLLRELHVKPGICTLVSKNFIVNVDSGKYRQRKKTHRAVFRQCLCKTQFFIW